MDTRGTVVMRFLALCNKAEFDDKQRSEVLKRLALVSDEYMEDCQADYVQGNMSMAVGFNMRGEAQPFVMCKFISKLEE